MECRRSQFSIFLNLRCDSCSEQRPSICHGFAHNNVPELKQTIKYNCCYYIHVGQQNVKIKFIFNINVFNKHIIVLRSFYQYFQQYLRIFTNIKCVIFYEIGLPLLTILMTSQFVVIYIIYFQRMRIRTPPLFYNHINT